MRDFGSFDDVIVVVGSAGCVLANWLSASGDRVLEAGVVVSNRA
jgi:choline dehydrogenase-like flavoprotein